MSEKSINLNELIKEKDLCKSYDTNTHYLTSNNINDIISCISTLFLKNNILTSNIYNLNYEEISVDKIYTNFLIIIKLYYEKYCG